MVEEEDYEVELPPEPPRPVMESGLLPGPPPDAPSVMTQQLLDSGARPIESVVPAFQTNEGVVYLASPADMERAGLMDWMAGRRFSRMRTVTVREIDRLMGEEGDDPSKWRR